MLLAPAQSDASLRKIWESLKPPVANAFKIVGGWVGVGAKASIDPALDGAFDRADRLTERAAQTFSAEFGSLARDATNDLDELAKKRLDQVDVMLGQRLDQVDRMLDRQLSRIDETAARLLDRQAVLIDDALLSVDSIAMRSVSQLGEISDRSLGRLQAIEEDAFDQLEAALQDQVPFMAGRLAREVEVILVLVLPFVALLITIAIRLGLGIRTSQQRTHASGCESVRELLGAWWSALRENVPRIPVWATAAGLPLAAGALLVHGAYLAYATAADVQRLQRLASAAEILEKANDFKAASVYRSRLFSLEGSRENWFWLERDTWLAAFAQESTLGNRSERVLRLRTLQTQFPEGFVRDAALRAAQLYLTPGVQDPRAVDRAALDARVQDWRREFLAGPTDAPALGELVLVLELRLALAGAEERSVRDRLDTALDIADDLLHRYPAYAPGYVARGAMLAYRANSQALGPDRSIPDALLARARDDFARAEELEPSRVRAMRLATASLPEALARELAELTDPAVVLAPAVRAARRASADAALAAFADELRSIAEPLYHEPTLVRAQTERFVQRAVRRDVGAVRLEKAVAKLRGAPLDVAAGPKSFATCFAIAKLADEIDLVDVADLWIEQALAASDVPAADDARWQAADQLRKGLARQSLTERLVLFL